MEKKKERREAATARESRTGLTGAPMVVPIRSERPDALLAVAGLRCYKRSTRKLRAPLDFNIPLETLRIVVCLPKYPNRVSFGLMTQIALTLKWELPNFSFFGSAVATTRGVVYADSTATAA